MKRIGFIANIPMDFYVGDRVSYKHMSEPGTVFSISVNSHKHNHYDVIYWVEFNDGVEFSISGTMLELFEET